MRWTVGRGRLPCLCFLLSVVSSVSPARASIPATDTAVARQEARRLDRLPPLHPRGASWIDESGRREKGRASWYGPGFVHKAMADGRPMNPQANIAASKTLPLGTTAQVVNLRNGRAVTVKIEDRGPFVDGRVVDVSPHVARELGMKTVGVVPVMVKPIAIPLANGDVRLGAGAADLTRQQIASATQATEALAGGGETETAMR